MKRLTSFSLALLIALTLTLVAGCGGGGTPTSSPSTVSGNESGETTGEYVGLWQASPVVGSGYAERLALNADGTFYRAESQMDGLTRERFSSGTWTVDNGVLKLAITERLVWEGGTVENNLILGGDALVGPLMVLVEEPGTLTYQLSAVTTDQKANGKQTFTADGTQYWELAAEPDSLRKDYEDARALALS